MSIPQEALVLGLVLSADSFTAAVALGFREHTRKQALAFAAVSGAAETLTTFAGAFAGAFIVQHFSAYDHWIAFFLLLGVALHMGWEGFEGLRHPQRVKESGAAGFHGFGRILLVSFATSLDALGVGLGLGVAEKPMLPFLVSIAFWAFVTTWVGLRLARRLSVRFGPAMALVGAVLLSLMSFQMLKI